MLFEQPWEGFNQLSQKAGEIGGFHLFSFLLILIRSKKILEKSHVKQNIKSLNNNLVGFGGVVVWGFCLFFRGYFTLEG